MQDTQFNKIIISINALIPLSFLIYDGVLGQLGANPVEYFLRSTGVLTLLFLLVALSITPLRRLFGWSWAVKYRRMLGLYSFFYGSLHLVTYSIFDRSLNLKAIVLDVWQRPFIFLGMLAFFLMVPLAVTSTNGWVKRLGGRNWQKLHKLIYPIAILGVIHFWLIVKSDVFYPVVFGFCLAILLGVRAWYAIQQKRAAVPGKPQRVAGLRTE